MNLDKTDNPGTQDILYRSPFFRDKNDANITTIILLDLNDIIHQPSLKHLQTIVSNAPQS
jgi:hypothetical protein